MRPPPGSIRPVTWVEMTRDLEAVSLPVVWHLARTGAVSVQTIEVVSGGDHATDRGVAVLCIRDVHGRRSAGTAASSEPSSCFTDRPAAGCRAARRSLARRLDHGADRLLQRGPR